MEQSDVFVSYRRKDVEFVKQLVKTLNAQGRDVWVDWEDIPPGVEGFGDEIQRGIENADAFIAVLSPAYLESEYCLMELREALKLKKRIVPVVFEKFDPAPPPEGIGHINWVYFTPHAGQENTFEQSFPKVIQALETDHEHTRNHTRLLTRAIEWDKRQRNYSYLLKGEEIDKAESWQVNASGKNPAPTELQLAYVLESRKQQRTQQRRITASIGVLLVLAVIAAVYAVFKANEARISAEAAHSSALASAALQPGNEEIAVALALEATRSQYAPESVYKALARVVYPIGGIRSIIKTSEELSGVISPAVSPDGAWIVVNNHLYDTKTGKMVREFENAPKFPLTGVFLPDGKRVILAGDRDVDEPSPDFIYLGMYDVDTGKLLQKFDTGIGIGDVQLSADGKTLIGFQPDGKAVWWNIQTGKKEREFKNDLWFYAFAFSPDLKWMAEVRNADDSGTAEIQTYKLAILDTRTGQVQQTIPLSTLGQIRFSPDSKEIAVHSGELATYNVETGEIITRFSNAPYSIVSLRYSPDGTSLVAASEEQTVTVWNRKTGEVIKTQTAHRDALVFADFAQSGKRVVSLDSSGVVMSWDVVPGNMDRGPAADIAADGITPDGHYLIFQELSPLGYLEAITIRDSQTMKEIARAPIQGISPETNERFTDVRRYSYHLENDLKQGLFFYTSQPRVVSEEGVLESVGILSANIASLTTGKILHTWNLDNNTYLQQAHFSPAGDRLYVAYTDENSLCHLEALSVTDNSVVQRYVEPFSGTLTFVLSPDGTRLLLVKSAYDPASNDSSQLIQMIDVSTTEVLFTLDTPAPDNVFFTPEGNQFIFTRASEVGVLKSLVSVYDSKTGNSLQEYTLDANSSSDFVIQPVEGSLVTVYGGGGGGGGGSTPSGIPFSGSIIVKDDVTQWDLTTGEQLWKFPRSTAGGIFSPDGKRMYSRFNGYLVTWRFDSHDELIQWACDNRYVPEFTKQQRERFGIENETSICKEPDN
jgi:WD40 repeat protein